MILEKIITGITFAAPVGPVTAEAIRRGLQGGFNPAFKVKFGAAIGDTILLVLVYYFVSSISNDLTRAYISLAGASVLFYLGLKNIRKGLNMSTDLNKAPSFDNGMFLGLGLALTNPFAVIFWFSIFSNVSLAEGSSQIMLVDGFYIIMGVLLWDVILCAMLEGGKKFVNPRMIKYITTGAGTCLCGFGLKYVVTAVRTLAFSI